jgi:nucleotide-binding universal stress UspA family protein
MKSETSQVVVGYDFSHSGRAALDRAIILAARAPFHTLHFACVLDPHVPLPRFPAKRVNIEYATLIESELESVVEQELVVSNVAGIVHFATHMRIGNAAEEILSVARDVGADLILVGSKGLKGIERLVLGSVSERVVREAGCTVEVVRPKTYADVELTNIVEVEPDRHYVPPHRYTYEDNRVTMRPADWPLY